MTFLHIHSPARLKQATAAGWYIEFTACAKSGQPDKLDDPPMAGGWIDWTRTTNGLSDKQLEALFSDSRFMFRGRPSKSETNTSITFAKL